eukprot:scaffold7738_cov133-Cylindrotheca_fusiformis.AAC.2
MSIDGAPSCWSEGSVFDDNDSIRSDAAVPREEHGIDPTYLKHTLPKAVDIPVQVNGSACYSPSLWDNVSESSPESRIDSSLLKHAGNESVAEGSQNVLFEDIRESPRRTKITVIEEDAIDEQQRLSVLNRDINLERRRRGADCKQRNLQVENSLLPMKSVDDSLLDYVITVDNASRDKVVEEEDFISDGVSLLTKEQVGKPLKQTTDLFDYPAGGLDHPLNNIMNNTNFMEEGLADIARCTFLTTLQPIEACNVLSKVTHRRNGVDVERAGDEKNTYFDFKALLSGIEGDTGCGKGTNSELSVVVEQRQPLSSNGCGDILNVSDCGENRRESETYNDPSQDLDKNTEIADVRQGISVSMQRNPTELLKRQEESSAVNRFESSRPIREPSTRMDSVSGENDPTTTFNALIEGWWSGLKLTKIDEGTKEKSRVGADEATVNESLDLSLDGCYAEERKNAQIFQVERLSCGETIGINLKAGKGGIVVDQISTTSPFRFTGLQPGMRILEINGIQCPGSLIVAKYLLLAIEGDIQLVVTNEEKKASVAPILFYSDY